MSDNQRQHADPVRVRHMVGERLPNGKWPVLRITTEVLSEHEDIFEAGDAARLIDGSLRPRQIIATIEDGPIGEILGQPYELRQIDGSPDAQG